MSYAIDLTPEFQSNYVLTGDFGFRIKITASIPSGGSTLTSLSNNTGYSGTYPAGMTAVKYAAASVFRYVRKPARADGVVEDVLSGVCSWPDYVELPVGAPDVDSLPACYRTNVIDLVVESETIANDLWILIQDRVTQLMQTISDGQLLASGTKISISI